MTEVDPMGQKYKEVDCISICKILSCLTEECATVKMETEKYSGTGWICI